MVVVFKKTAFTSINALLCNCRTVITKCSVPWEIIMGKWYIFVNSWIDRNWTKLWYLTIIYFIIFLHNLRVVTIQIQLNKSYSTFHLLHIITSYPIVLVIFSGFIYIYCLVNEYSAKFNSYFWMEHLTECWVLC